MNGRTPLAEAELRRATRLERDPEFWRRVAADRAFRVAGVACALAIVGLGVDMGFWWWTYRRVPFGHLATMIAAIAWIAVLYVKRGHPEEWLGSLAFTLNNAAILAALWITDGRLLHTSHWNPFDAQKLGALTVALLAPPRAWVGALNIAAYTLVPITEALWSGRAVWKLAPAAPFASFAYGAFAFGILALQLRRLSKEQADAQGRAQSAAVERFVGMVLALRDYANTPLQTIELTMARIRRGGRVDPRALDRLGRACAKLIEIGRVLEDAERDARAPWDRSPDS